MKKLLLLLFLIGCHGTVDVSEHTNFRSVDQIKRHYFTPEAYEAIKDIPAVDGFGVSGWVIGVNFWSSLVGIFTLNGIGRKVIVPEECLKKLGKDVFIHEYIHHLDDMDRDGEGEWIDHEEFKKAYKDMANHADLVEISPGICIKVYKYPHIINEVETKSNKWITNTFSIGAMSEQIAYMAHIMIEKGAPDYMWEVYKKILKRN